MRTSLGYSAHVPAILVTKIDSFTSSSTNRQSLLEKSTSVAAVGHSFISLTRQFKQIIIIVIIVKRFPIMLSEVDAVVRDYGGRQGHVECSQGHCKDCGGAAGLFSVLLGYVAGVHHPDFPPQVLMRIALKKRMKSDTKVINYVKTMKKNPLSIE